MIKPIPTSIPFSPARVPFFYGWVILLLGAAGTVASIPGQTMGVSVLTDALIDAMGLTRVQLSLAYLVGTLISAFLLPRAGRLYDEVGARVLMAATAALLGLVLLVLPEADHLANGLGHLLPEVRAVVLAWMVMTGLFLLIRLFGQGMLTMVSRNMVMKWFVERRGLANAMMGVVISFGFSATPGILNTAIEQAGWRMVWRGLGLIIGGGFALLALLLARDNPQECGLAPDGPLKSLGGRRRVPAEPDTPWTMEEARRTYAFWVFGLSMALFALYTTAMTFHIASLFEVADMSRSQAFGIFLPAAFLSVPLQILSSWWSDYTRLKYLLLIMLGGMLMSLAALTFLAPGWSYGILIVGNGIMGSQFGLIMSVTWPRLFGTLHLGAISGMVMGWVVAGSAVGPYLFSLSENYTGGYRPALVGCLLATAFLAACATRANPPPQKKT